MDTKTKAATPKSKRQPAKDPDVLGRRRQERLLKGGSARCHTEEAPKARRQAGQRVLRGPIRRASPREFGLENRTSGRDARSC